MHKTIKFLFLAFLFCAAVISSARAYDIPQRKIEVKPYLNFLFPNNIWERANLSNPIENKMAPGLGLKMRTQFSGQFGIVLNASYISFDVADNVSSDGGIFAAGGYFSRALSFGSMTFDLSYGIIAANHEVAGLLMPSLEYSRPISERLALAIELEWPIPNDWPQKFEFEEKYGSFGLSLGCLFTF